MSGYNLDWEWSVSSCCHNAFGLVRTVCRIPRPISLGIWLHVSHVPLCIVTTDPSKTSLNPLIAIHNQPYDIPNMLCFTGNCWGQFVIIFILMYLFCKQVKASDVSVINSYLQMSQDRKTWHRRWFAVHEDFVMYSFKAHQVGPISQFHLNTLRLRQNGCHFADDIFKCNFLQTCILIKISVNFVANDPIDNQS